MLFEKKDNGVLELPQLEREKVKAKEKFKELRRAKKKATTVAELAQRVELLERMLGVE